MMGKIKFMEDSYAGFPKAWPGRDVHLWSFDLNLPAAEIKKYKNTLSEDEVARADRFYFEKDQNQSIITRGCMRAILALYLKTKPAQIEFSYNTYGKPVLAADSLHPGLHAGLREGLSFNLSHSHEIGMLAVAQAYPVGIDIEFIREDLDYLEIARRFFSPHEVSDLEGLPKNAQKEAFFHCWARKEAYIKAVGGGLSVPLDSFDVSLKPGEPAALLATRPNPEGASEWKLYRLDIPANYAGALAIQGKADQLRYLHWTEDGS
jgi:4'-phosphopantetheinyl transferase